MFATTVAVATDFIMLGRAESYYTVLKGVNQRSVNIRSILAQAKSKWKTLKQD
jgi:hypothetical protein